MTETSELDGIAVNRDYKNILQWNIGILQCISVILNPIYIIYIPMKWQIMGLESEDDGGM